MGTFKPLLGQWPLVSERETQLMPMSVLILTPASTTQLELHGSCLESVERLIELRGENVYISYAFCGSAYAEHPCYLTAEPELPYPYCCPRSFCPRDLDIATNEIDTEYYDDELQMAANDISNSVRIQAPDSFKKHDSDIKSHENVVSYNVDMKNSFEDEEYQLDWDSLFGAADS